MIVNCSQGQLVDIDALVEALREGRVSGCALDVLPGDSLTRTTFPRAAEQLLTLPGADSRVIITPHIAGRADRSVALTRAWIVDQLEQWASEFDDSHVGAKC
jgi:D-3-phosphoglycerate dehydrogenase